MDQNIHIQQHISTYLYIYFFYPFVLKQKTHQNPVCVTAVLQ